MNKPLLVAGVLSLNIIGFGLIVLCCWGAASDSTGAIAFIFFWPVAMPFWCVGLSLREKILTSKN